VARAQGNSHHQVHTDCNQELFLRLGFISFRGPTGQIAIMHAELAEKRKWISETRSLRALNYCMLLPGPEAQQLATYILVGFYKTWAGILAGALLS
jgi:chromate transporter